MDESPQTPPQSDSSTCPGVRHGLIAFGWLNVALGILGMMLPVMPTTVFLLIALWAFSKSSPRFHRWLFTHPRLGRTIRAWHTHRVIPKQAKLLAVGMMSASLLYVTLFVAEDWVVPVILGVVLATIAAYIVTRPSRVAAEHSSP
jgi:uncharacterized membrane protein YbaN (DUF454 family)